MKAQFKTEEDALAVVQFYDVQCTADFQCRNVLLVPEKIVRLNYGQAWDAINYLCNEHGYVWRDATNYN
jgi:hypothetical protein